MEELIRQAKARLPDGWTIKIYVEFNFAYVFITRDDGSVFNIDMHQKLTIAEQLEIAVNSLGPCRCSSHELPEHNGHCPLYDPAADQLALGEPNAPAEHSAASADTLRRDVVPDMLVCDVCGKVWPEDDEHDNATAICDCGRMKCRMECATRADIERHNAEHHARPEAKRKDVA